MPYLVITASNALVGFTVNALGSQSRAAELAGPPAACRALVNGWLPVDRPTKIANKATAKALARLVPGARVSLYRAMGLDLLTRLHGEARELAIRDWLPAIA